MIDRIREELGEIDSKTALGQYELILELTHQFLSLLQRNNDKSHLKLAQELRDKVHRIRYVIAYNKATDIGEYDANLKEIWKMLNSVIELDSSSLSKPKPD